MKKILLSVNTDFYFKKNFKHLISAYYVAGAFSFPP